MSRFPCKDGLAHVWQDSFWRDVRDRVRFTTASGAICKDCSIVSVQDTVEESFRGGFVDIVLVCVVVKDSIEDKRLVLDPFSLGSNGGS